MAVTDCPHHPVGMSEHLIPVPGDEMYTAIKDPFQIPSEIVCIMSLVLHQDLICHEHAVLKLNHVTSVYYIHGSLSVQFQTPADR